MIRVNTYKHAEDFIEIAKEYNLSKVFVNDTPIQTTYALPVRVGNEHVVHQFAVNKNPPKIGMYSWLYMHHNKKFTIHFNRDFENLSKALKLLVKADKIPDLNKIEAIYKETRTTKGITIDESGTLTIPLKTQLANYKNLVLTVSAIRSVANPCAPTLKQECQLAFTLSTEYTSGLAKEVAGLISKADIRTVEGTFYVTPNYVPGVGANEADGDEE